MNQKNNNNQNNGEGVPSAKQPVTMRYATYIYAALALCVLTVLAVSIISAANRVPDIEISMPEVSVPSVIRDTSKSPAERGEKPVDGEQSGVTADISEPPVMEDVKFVVPCEGKIQKGHSVTKLVFSETMQDYRTHSGIDISADVGTKVVAYSDGKIISVSDDPLMGKTITISHEGGLKSVTKTFRIPCRTVSKPAPRLKRVRSSVLSAKRHVSKRQTRLICILNCSSTTRL